EVLAVHAQPVAGTAREPEVAVLVAVAEVARPVPAVADTLGIGLGVVVVALEAAGAGLVHDLADGFLGVEQPSVVVEPRPMALLVAGRVEDEGGVVLGQTQGSLGHVRYPAYDGPTLAHPVALDDAAAEAALE